MAGESCFGRIPLPGWKTFTRFGSGSGCYARNSGGIRRGGGAFGRQRGAIIYTLIESCRRRKIDPYAYLRDILARLPNLRNTEIAEATPAALKLACSIFRKSGIAACLPDLVKIFALSG